MLMGSQVRAYGKEWRDDSVEKLSPLGYSRLSTKQRRKKVRNMHQPFVVSMIEWYCVICSGPAVVASLV